MSTLYRYDMDELVELPSGEKISMQQAEAAGLLETFVDKREFSFYADGELNLRPAPIAIELRVPDVIICDSEGTRRWWQPPYCPKE